MKILLFSDLHIFNHFSMSIFEDIAQKFIHDLHLYCKVNKINKIIFLGDWFHLKNKVQVPSYIKSWESLKLFKDSKIDIVFLIGNHDSPQADTNDQSILYSFENYGKIIPLYDWEDIDGIRFHYLSYTKELPKFELSSGKNILCGHLDVNNFLMEGSFICTNGFTEESFEDFEHVYSGHFHKHQERHNITFIGTPYQTRFSERNDDKGFIVYDTITGKDEFVVYDSAPTFKEISAEDEDESTIKGNFVRVKVSKDSGDLNQIKNKMLSLGAQNVEFIFESETEEKELNIIEDLTMGSMKEIASSYYDALVEGNALSNEIQSYLDDEIITKNEIMAIFDEIEMAYLTGWKVKEDE